MQEVIGGTGPAACCGLDVGVRRLARLLGPPEPDGPGGERFLPQFSPKCAASAPQVPASAKRIAGAGASVLAKSSTVRMDGAGGNY